MKIKRSTSALTALAVLPLALAWCGQAVAQAPEPPEDAPAGDAARDAVAPNPENGVARLKLIYGLFQKYRELHGGAYPPAEGSAFDPRGFGVLDDVFKNPRAYGFDTAGAVTDALNNPDDAKKDDSFARQRIKTFTGAQSVRPDGTAIGGAKEPGAIDVLAFTSAYAQEKVLGRTRPQIDNPVGFFQLLGDGGQIWRLDYDEQLFIYDLNPDKPRSLRVSFAFPGQAGVPYNCLTYAEKAQASADAFGSGPFVDERTGKAFTIKPASQPVMPRLGARMIEELARPAPDNGAIESLVALSRLRRAARSEPLDRPQLWKLFGLQRDVFSLEDTRQIAVRVKVPLQLKKLTLDDLAQQNVPAILDTNDKRQAVLSQLDEAQAIVIDRGVTRILARGELARLYAGQALIADVAASAKAPQARAEDAIRVLPVKSLDEPISVQVKISNAGGAPLSLQIERAIPGCERAELSASTLAPGASATLSLSLRWRKVLKSPTQNVLAFIATNDPRCPRLPLGFLLDNRRVA